MLDCTVDRRMMLDLARALRRNMTPWERALWYKFLRYYPLRIRRQHIMGNYIMDFYCRKAKVAIELDGQYHRELEAAYADQRRDRLLEAEGIRVLRFNNSDVDHHFREVCVSIDRAIRGRVAVDVEYPAVTTG